jgi:NAD(P)-dependent dehydrogenase (short-subunit alcohol dehydrogenase family)
VAGSLAIKPSRIPVEDVVATVVITGATAGVGRATARVFAERDAALGLIARGGDGLDATVAELRASGARVCAISADVADAGAVEDAAASFERQLGPIDVWVNNAMVSVFSPVDLLTADEVRRVTEVTYLGYVYGTLCALKRMRARDRGTIVQVGSALAYRAIPLQAAYCGAKHAIEGFTQSLRCELLHDRSRVRVTMVQLPAVNTPHQPRQPQSPPRQHSPRRRRRKLRSIRQLQLNPPPPHPSTPPATISTCPPRSSASPCQRPAKARRRRRLLPAPSCCSALEPAVLLDAAEGDSGEPSAAAPDGRGIPLQVHVASSAASSSTTPTS